MSVSVAQAPSRTTRCARVLLSPWARLALLVALLTVAATVAVLYRPQQLLAGDWSPQVPGLVAVLLFAVGYGLFATAFAPRPVLNLAAGALFGGPAGTVSALAGTVLAAGLSFGLGRSLGQEALRTLLRGRSLRFADRQLSRHGFRTVLLMRLVPGVPFAASNYGSSVSRMRWLPFLAGTGLGSIPNTGAYAVAGSHAAAPTSPVFLAAFGFIVLSGLGAALLAWRARIRLRSAQRR